MIEIHFSARNQTSLEGETPCNPQQPTSMPFSDPESAATLPPLPHRFDLLSENIDLHFPAWQEKLQAHLNSPEGKTGSTISTVQDELIQIIELIAEQSALKIPSLGGIDCAGLVEESSDVISYLDKNSPTSIGQQVSIAGGQEITLDWEVVRRLLRVSIELAQ